MVEHRHKNNLINTDTEGKNKFSVTQPLIFAFVVNAFASNYPVANPDLICCMLISGFPHTFSIHLSLIHVRT